MNTKRMNEDRETKVRNSIRYCIENFDSQTATNRIVEFWKDELKLANSVFNNDAPCGDCSKQNSPCRTINCQYDKSKSKS